MLLVLPEEHAFATLQRAPWFKPDSQPEDWLHDGSTPRLQPLPTQADTTRELSKRLQGTQTLKGELRAASTPAHLGGRTGCVFDLVEWATGHPQLDSGHRRGQRAWHCMGQKVLSIRTTTTGVAITAGIHYTKADQAPMPLEVTAESPLGDAALQSMKDSVAVGIAARFDSNALHHRPDEHWLQAVVRRDPSLVGVEQPALREVPAWRPCGGVADDPADKWGRGYIDLLGVDGHGDVRLVETKLASNQDDLLVFQGLDYYVWVNAYREAVLDRLGVASKKTEFEIHYVIAETTDGKLHLSRFAASHARSLDPSIRWRFQTVHAWFESKLNAARARTRLLPLGELP